MSSAYKCDRCGSLYERELTPRRVTEITIDRHYYGLVHLDLCDKCHEELMDWINKFGMVVKEEDQV